MSIDIWCPPLIPGREQLLSSPEIRTAYQHHGGTSKVLHIIHQLGTVRGHQTRAYPSFCSMKWPGISLLSPPPQLGWDASPSQGYTLAFNSPVPIYTPGWREALMRAKCTAQEHNTMSLARAWTQTAQSKVMCTNHEATMPPHHYQLYTVNLLHLPITCKLWSSKPNLGTIVV